jgi:hypothetical protein
MLEHFCYSNYSNRWQTHLSDMYWYLVGNFRTTDECSGPGSTTLPHSFAFLWLLGPLYFYVRRIKDKVLCWSKYSHGKLLEFGHRSDETILYYKTFFFISP